MQRLIKGVEDVNIEKVFGHNVAMTFNRRQMLMFQYVKLLNYFNDDLSLDWGGSYIEGDMVPAPIAAARFLDYMDDVGEGATPWITKRHDTQPWSNENIKLSDTPDPQLGAPFEAYVSLDGSMMTINQASRILCVNPGVLVTLKLKLFYDELVILESIKRQLRPRTEWPRITARQGVRGRTLRFGKK